MSTCQSADTLSAHSFYICGRILQTKAVAQHKLHQNSRESEIVLHSSSAAFRAPKVKMGMFTGFQGVNLTFLCLDS